eukprot:15443194-Alexandrium_andersonii.AAC.1
MALGRPNTGNEGVHVCSSSPQSAMNLSTSDPDPDPDLWSPGFSGPIPDPTPGARLRRRCPVPRSDRWGGARHGHCCE